ncbi:MAG TPA: TIGR03013 family XrtA/PEP-CTERM system glycosyltransferase, partial [Burkholderiaceae bacterium]|nr:TIGR03013 family XrtA/PEP-CTERM system glycosyltransferase [Burkholderiaceae bacterium]
FGLYRREFGATTFAQTVGRIVLALGIGLPVAYLLFTALPNGALVRSVLGYALLYAFCGMVLVRQAVQVFSRLGVGAKRVLIVGTGTEAVTVEESLQTLRHPRFDVVGFYQTSTGGGGVVEHDRMVPRSIPLMEVVNRLDIKEVIVAVREQRGGVLPLRELLECRVRGIPVTDLSGFYERVRGEVPIDSLKASWLIYANGFEQGSLRTLIKRGFDLLASSVLFAATLPLMLLTALAIKLESPGPIIYQQERVGRAGRPFTLLKFRSMRSDAEKDGIARWASVGDPRVTRIGRLIRRTRIDELPQLLNVLRGEMSFVGPRPERPNFVGQLKEQIPFYDLRHSVKPGVTGWAQVRYSYGASVEEARTKLQFDLYYVKNHSLFLDVLILFETVRVIMFREGAH